MPTKVHLVKAMIFPVVMYGCESWTVKKAECQIIDAFELWCWRRLLEVPWTARRSNKSILKEISPGCSLEGLMLKLKLQYFGHLIQRTDSFEKTWCWERLRAAGEGDNRGWDGWMASPIQWTWVWVDSGSWWWTGRPGMLQFLGLQKVGHNWATELNWTEARSSPPPPELWIRMVFFKLCNFWKFWSTLPGANTTPCPRISAPNILHWIFIILRPPVRTPSLDSFISVLLVLSLFT